MRNESNLRAKLIKRNRLRHAAFANCLDNTAIAVGHLVGMPLAGIPMHGNIRACTFKPNSLLAR